MDFSTPCCTRPPPERRACGRLCAALWCLLALLLWQAPGARAQDADALASVELERERGALYLSASLAVQLPRLVQDALLKGIAMHFIAEAEVVRERWYWTNKTLAHAQRHLRLSYQPLTRRWRLVQSSQPLASGFGVMLGQSFDDLADALAVMQRIVRWQIVPEGTLDDALPYLLRFSFRLDQSQLPRPLQWGGLGHSGWNLLIERSLPAPAPTDTRVEGAR